MSRRGTGRPRRTVVAIATLAAITAGLVLVVTAEGAWRAVGVGIVVTASTGEAAYWLHAAHRHQARRRDHCEHAEHG